MGSTSRARTVASSFAVTTAKPSNLQAKHEEQTRNHEDEQLRDRQEEHEERPRD